MDKPKRGGKRFGAGRPQTIYKLDSYHTKLLKQATDTINELLQAPPKHVLILKQPSKERIAYLSPEHTLKLLIQNHEIIVGTLGEQLHHEKQPLETYD